MGEPGFAQDTITGVAFTADGSHVAANYLNDHVYLFAMDGLEQAAASMAAAEGAAARSRRARRDDSTAGGRRWLSWRNPTAVAFQVLAAPVARYANLCWVGSWNSALPVAERKL